MDIEINESNEPAVTYADLRTGKLFCWWAIGELLPGCVYLKGETGYTRLSTGDFIEVNAGSMLPKLRVRKLQGKLTVDRE